MALLGTNLPSDGTAHINTVASVYPQGIIRVNLEPKYDIRTYFDKAASLGLDLLGLITSESHDLSNRRLSYDEAATLLIQRYGKYFKALQVGNEWDHISDSSWTLSPDELFKLMTAYKKARDAAGYGFPIVLGGAVSGDTNRLYDIANTLKIADGFSVHPYGQRYSPNVPAPAGDFGFASSYVHHIFAVQHLADSQSLITRYLDTVRGILGRSLPCYISEYGVSSWQVGEEAQATYCAGMAQYLKSRADIVAACHFCHHSYLGFGETEDDGRVKSIRKAMMQVTGGNWVPTPTPSPVEPTKPGDIKMPIFQGGFAKEAARLGEAVVGKPLHNEDYIPTERGNKLGFQRTDKGLFFWTSETGDEVAFYPKL